jgi:hypothetical protein
VLKATEQEIEEVREYFEWQAPDLEVTFMQKVYSEAATHPPPLSPVHTSPHASVAPPSLEGDVYNSNIGEWRR